MPCCPAPVTTETDYQGVWRIDYVTCSGCGKALRIERRARTPW